MPDPVDPERPRGDNAFDHGEGYSGQDYGRAREPAEAVHSAADTRVGNADIPSHNGARAGFDPATGEVHGAGIGAGGGQVGEDFDSDAQNGDGYPISGGEGQIRTPGDLGPAHRD